MTFAPPLAPRLDQRQAQTLVMTPQLQQAIKLLQMSALDVSAFVAAELESNPLLERAEGEGALQGETVSLDAPCGPGGAARAPEPAQVGADGAESPDVEAGERAADPYADRTYDGGEGGAGSGLSLAETLAERPSLREHLRGQIHMDFADPAERMIAIALMELLDEAGYLPQELELARAQMGASPELFEQVIEKVQRLDPPGIFARSLKECLAIQLREKDRLDPAMAALLDHLDLLAKRDLPGLMRHCGVDGPDLADMIAEVRALSPKPALAFAADAAPAIVPDVLLLPLPKGGWHVELSAQTLPRVLVNEQFYARIQAGARSARDKTYVAERWQQANWLVKALRQRAETILKVATEIVKKQDSFFVFGVGHLKPLVLRDIAQAVEMHESTISRVTQNKFIATPRGMFELKYFFSNALPSMGGDQSVSTLSVKARIKAMIEAERPDAILSDDALAALLRGEGIEVARRTVAKYREALGIPTSAARKRAGRS